ncbi:MAG: hypothetical protein IJ180_00410 [Bacteroidales bacterium]|nr:hypothetical protein [Bacteroidales bacterium]
MTIAKDKKLHFAVNFVSAFIGGIYGVCFGLGASVGKEYGDSKAVGNKWDWLDIIADCIGLGVGFVFNRLLLIVVK